MPPVFDFPAVELKADKQKFAGNAGFASTPHHLHPNCESGPNYFPPKLFFSVHGKLKTLRPPLLPLPVGASFIISVGGHGRDVRDAGTNPNARTQMRTQIGPKCVDPILPHRYKDGWVAAKFGSTGNRRTLSNHIWVHIWVHIFGSTRSGSLHTFGSTHSVPTRRTESKKKQTKNKPIWAQIGALIFAAGGGEY